MQIPEYKDRDDLLLRLGFSSYELYLQGDLWKQIRLRAYKVHGKKCRICGSNADVLHHKNYKWEIMSGKSLKGLVPLCHDCHKVIEFSPTGWKRTLDGTNNKLAELTSSHTTHKKKLPYKPKSYGSCPPTKKEKRRNKRLKLQYEKGKRRGGQVCKFVTPTQVVEADIKLRDNLRHITKDQSKAGSSPLSRFMRG